jgi:membrane protein DedA with SNARE-associated domain
VVVRFRVGLVLGFSVGYYLGARAGRERYEQLRGWLGHMPLAKVHAAVELGRERLRNGDPSDAVVPPSPN